MEFRYLTLQGGERVSSPRVLDLCEVGLRLRKARLAKKLSQGELAEISNVSLNHISDIENGKKGMSLSTFVQIILALQVSADEILRLDLPGVQKIYQKDLNDLLIDCSPAESEAIMNAARGVKAAIRKLPENDKQL